VVAEAEVTLVEQEAFITHQPVVVVVVVPTITGPIK
jgi:hypothetical protein